MNMLSIKQLNFVLRLNKYLDVNVWMDIFLHI